MDEREIEFCESERVHDDVVNKVKENLTDDDTLFDLAELFKVFGDSTRIRILSALSVEELCVCDIADLISMTKSAVSHQLRILRSAKLVKFRKNGKEVYYSLDDDHIYRILNLGKEHINEKK